LSFGLVDKGTELTASLFFDLDGTLTDPRIGIVRCFQYALRELGCPSPSDGQLVQYIGPPLRESFALILKSTDDELIGKAVSLYRRRFSSTGMFENTVYPGIPNALAELRSYNVLLYVVTSKPTVFSTQILTHFGLRRFFQNTYGSELDGRRSRKEELIAHVLAEESIQASKAVMVGDREHDIAGALANGVIPVGILWGYGSQQELTGAGTLLLCDSPDSLIELLSSIPPLQGTLTRLRPRTEYR